MEREIVCRNCRTPVKTITVDEPPEYKFSYYCSECEELVRVAAVERCEDGEDNRIRLMRKMAYRSVESAWRERGVGRTEAYVTAFSKADGVNPGDFYLLSLTAARAVAFTAARLGVEGAFHDGSAD